MTTPDTEYYDPQLASSMYYVLSLSAEGTLTSKGFSRLERARPYAQDLEAQGVTTFTTRHSKLALRDLPMDVLQKIVKQQGSPVLDTKGSPLKVATLKRRELVDVAYGRLSSVTDYSSLVEERRMGTAVEPEAPAKVRELRKEKGKKSAKGKKATATKAAKGGGKRGAPRGPRASDEFAGKKITLTDKSKNPRREGTHGHRSMEIVLKHPGITYEDYTAKGGRRVDLKGSLELGEVKVS